MPKAHSYNSVKIRGYIKEFGEDILSTDGKILICSCCGIKVNRDKKHHIQQHLQTEKHKKAATLKLAPKAQPIISFLNNATSNEFFRDLTKMMVACDIPLIKANHKEFRSFMEKYVQKKVPDQSTMRKHYLKEIYENVLEEIRSHIGNSSIFVSIDETTDKAGRFVCNVIVGPLRQGGRGFLLTSEVIQKVNASEIAKLFDDALKILWPEEVKRDKVLIFVTDAAPYMKKSVVGIQLFYPRMIHITCVAHGVHRVCEKLRSQYAEVDSLVANMKKIFSKSPTRIRFFQEKQPDLPLPPQPVLTRWGTWLEAVSYYAKNFNGIKDIVDGLNDDAACVIFAKKLFANKGIREDLAYIQANFGFIVGERNSFKILQKRGEPINNVLDALQNIENNLKQARGPVATTILEKFNMVFQANQGLQVIKKIAGILNGEKSVAWPENITTNEVEFLNWAPLVSVDVERSFSSFKSMLRDNRMRLLPENFKMHLVALCYYDSKGEKS